jgi:hypothetical protein
MPVVPGLSTLHIPQGWITASVTVSGAGVKPKVASLASDASAGKFRSTMREADQYTFYRIPKLLY